MVTFNALLSTFSVAVVLLVITVDGAASAAAPAGLVYRPDKTHERVFRVTFDGDQAVSGACALPLVATPTGCRFKVKDTVKRTVLKKGKPLDVQLKGGKFILQEPGLLTSLDGLGSDPAWAYLAAAGTVKNPFTFSVVSTDAAKNTAHLKISSPVSSFRFENVRYKVRSATVKVARPPSSTSSRAAMGADQGALVITMASFPHHHRRKLTEGELEVAQRRQLESAEVCAARSGVYLPLFIVGLAVCLITALVPPILAACLAATVGTAVTGGLLSFATCMLASSGGCFPGDGLARLPSGSQLPMAALEIGYLVASEPSRFSDVYYFSHRDASAISLFQHIVLSSNASIDASPRHILPFATSPHGQRLYKYAMDIETGDFMWEFAGGSYVPRAVTSNSMTVKPGLYNLYTLDGVVEVNGILASCYADKAVMRYLDPVVSRALVPYLPMIYDGLRAPNRLLYHAIGSQGVKEVYQSLNQLAKIGSDGLSYIQALGSGATAYELVVAGKNRFATTGSIGLGYISALAGTDVA